MYDVNTRKSVRTLDCVSGIQCVAVETSHLLFNIDVDGYGLKKYISEEAAP